MADSTSPERVIVELSAFGDTVHAVSFAAMPRGVYTAARIDWLVSAKHREILDLVPVIDRGARRV